MKLHTVSIKNFRGMLEGTISLCDYSLLVGANNAGKSTVIDAIRAFYEKDGYKFKADRDLPLMGAKEKEAWVELTFGLSQEEHDSLAEDYKSDQKTLRLRRYFETKAKTESGESAKGYIFAYKTDGSISTTPFYGAKNVQSGKIGDIVFIPAVSKVDEHTKLSGPSALRDLLTSVMETVVDGSPSFQAFDTHFEEFADGIKTEKSEDGRSLIGVEDEINTELSAWGAKFKLKLRSPSTAEIIKSLLDPELYDGTSTTAMTPDQFGSGFQRHFIYSLIQISARYSAKKTAKKAKDFAPNMTLVLFEEPEAFLHPPQQEVLARSLMALGTMPNRQVLCSTHSPHFVSKNAGNIPSIVRLKRTNGQVAVHQINKDDWENIADANQAITQIAARYPQMAKKLQQEDMLPEMEAVKQFLWLNPDRCGLFFANHVILVEGPSETALINKMIGDGKIMADHCGLYVLDCMGKYNIHRFMNLVIHLGIPHSIMHDDDFDANEHKDINELIRTSRDRNLTVALETIRGELEMLLGVKPAGARHRKPQHLMYLYETGKMQKANLDIFSTLVQKCLPALPSS